jgi:hypothetical protein
VKQWFNAIRWLLAFAAVNFFLWPLTTVLLPRSIATLGFNVVRISLMVWAGWAVTRAGGLGLGGAALAAIMIMAVDHVFLKGGAFLVEHVRGHSTEHLSYLAAFGGVVASFVMFSPVAALLGLCGGFYGRHSKSAHPS